MRTRRGSRGGFTLIELLVVMSIIVFLAGLTAVLIGSFSPSFKASSGADVVAGQLLGARQTAKRDNTPTGVRFIMNTNSLTTCNELVLVSQPADVAQGVYVGRDSATRARIRVPAGAPFPVQAGDYLELYGGGVIRRIVAVGADPAQPGYTDYLVDVNAVAAGGVDLPDVSANPPTFGVSPTNYRVVRQTQPVKGESSVILPGGVMIDFSSPTWNGGLPLSSAPAFPNPPPNAAYAEILFGPSGAVVGQGTTGTITLWVRRGALNASNVIEPDNSVDHLAGTPRITTIYVKTGAIAQHPVSRKTDPFEFTRDGRSSGM